jgi:hypothetical protein
MTAATLQAAPQIAMPAPQTISRSSADSGFRTGTKCITGRSERPVIRSASPSCGLDLSKSRAHDAVLGILRAYKLTGNFHVNLEIVLKDIGVFDKVTYQIERNPKLSSFQDCRHVVFKPNGNVPSDMFGEIIKSIKARIGFDASWWVRLIRAFYDKVDPPGVIARLDPRSGLPDFGIKLSKSETSDFDAIQYPRPVVTRSPGQSPDQVGGGR